MVSDPDRLQQAADLYADTFAGQRAAYSFWNGEHWQAAYDWNDGHPTLRTLSAEVVIDAFKTGVPISGYVLGPDNYTHVACLDIDREDGLSLGIQIARHVRDLGGEGYIERSRRGAHVWMILDERRAAVLVRRALTALIKESLRELRICPGAGQKTVPNKGGRPSCCSCHRSEQGPRAAPHRDPRIELRPASDRLPDTTPGEKERLGHCIRLPTMPHQKTGKRYPLISFSEGTVLPGKLADMMSMIERTPVSIFEDLAERAPLPKLGAPPADLAYPHGRPELESACDILRELWGVNNAQPGRAIKCPAHDDRRPSLSIARDDQRVWCHSPICELNNDGRGRGTHELRAMAPALKGA